MLTTRTYSLSANLLRLNLGARSLALVAEVNMGTLRSDLTDFSHHILRFLTRDPEPQARPRIEDAWPEPDTIRIPCAQAAIPGAAHDARAPKHGVRCVRRPKWVGVPSSFDDVRSFLAGATPVLGPVARGAVGVVGARDARRLDPSPRPVENRRPVGVEG